MIIISTVIKLMIIYVEQCLKYGFEKNMQETCFIILRKVSTVNPIIKYAHTQR